MIDFSALALGPGIAVFARPFTVRPVASQPAAPQPYDGRGVWTSKPTEIVTEEGRVLNTSRLTLGVRLSEFEVAPKARDLVDIPAHLSLPAEGLCWIEDIDPDGQGGATLVLKRGAPPPERGTRRP